MSASDTLYLARKLGQRKKGNGREAPPPSGVKLRGIIVGGLTKMAETDPNELDVAKKLGELLTCGKPAIELRAAEVIEKFTRDNVGAEQPEDLELTPEEIDAMLTEVAQALGKRIVTP